MTPFTVTRVVEEHPASPTLTDCGAYATCFSSAVAILRAPVSSVAVESQSLGAIHEFLTRWAFDLSG